MRLLLLHKADNEAERQGKLLDEQIKLINRQFLFFIQRLTTDDALERIATYAVRARIEEVLRAIDAAIDQLGNSISQAFFNTAQTEAEALADQLSAFTKARSRAVSLDLSNTKLTAAANRTRAGFVNTLTRQQRDLVRQSLVEGIRAGDSIEQIAKRFANTIGLSKPQRQAVVNYQRSLEEGSREALSRQLRNPKFDERLETVIDEGGVLTTAQIEQMVGAYTRNLRKARAETIAQTEGLKLVNTARNIAVRQVAENAGVDLSKGTKTWLRTSSTSPRDNHLEVVGVTIKIDEAFDVGSARMLYPGDTSLGAGPGDIVNCKCGVQYNLGE